MLIASPTQYPFSYWITEMTMVTPGIPSTGGNVTGKIGTETVVCCN